MKCLLGWKLIQRILIISGALSLVACATTQTTELTLGESGAFDSKTLIYTKYKDTPDFYAQTALNVQFGLIGAAKAISAGNAIIEKNNIQDPAKEIAHELATGLAEAHKFKLISNHGIVSSSHHLADIISLYGEYDYILDVHTFGWGFQYYPTNWDNYKVYIQMEARLIDSKTKTVIAEGYCHHAPEYEDTDLAPNYKQLESGDVIKQDLAKSVTYCIEHIRSTAKLHRKQM